MYLIQQEKLTVLLKALSQSLRTVCEDLSVLDLAPDVFFFCTLIYCPVSCVITPGVINIILADFVYYISVTRELYKLTLLLVALHYSDVFGYKLSSSYIMVLPGYKSHACDSKKVDYFEKYASCLLSRYNMLV